MEAVTCFKCEGSEYLPQYKHKDDGICYPCKGTGELKRATIEKAGILFEYMVANERSTKKDLIVKIIQLVNENDELERESQHAKRDFDFETAYYFDTQIAENMTKIHKLRKEAGI